MQIVETFTKDDIKRILNFKDIPKEFNKDLQDLLVIDRSVFTTVVTSPVVREIQTLNSFSKTLQNLHNKAIVLIPKFQFIFYVLATQKEHLLPKSYKYHSITFEIKNHYLIRINGDVSLRFEYGKNSVIIKDVITHSDRGY